MMDSPTFERLLQHISSAASANNIHFINLKNLPPLSEVQWQDFCAALAKCKSLQYVVFGTFLDGGFEPNKSQLQVMVATLPKRIAIIVDWLRLRDFQHEEGFYNDLDGYYDRREGALIRTAYKHSKTKITVLCAMYDVVKLHAIRKETLLGDGFLMRKEFYDQLAPYLTWQDVKNIRAAFSTPPAIQEQHQSADDTASVKPKTLNSCCTIV